MRRLVECLRKSVERKRVGRRGGVQQMNKSNKINKM